MTIQRILTLACSYGGHYAPIVSEYFVEQNAKNISGAHEINLEGVMIGNGWYDPLIQYQAYYNFSVSPGNTYGYDPLNQSVKGKLPRISLPCGDS